MKQPDVSVIIVNYNSSGYTIDCVKSITDNDVEIIIVDNSPLPGEPERLKSIDDARVKIIFNEINSGFAKSSNQGIIASKGRYIFLLNPDTIVIKDCIRKLVTYMETLPKAGAVGPRMWWDRDKTLQSPEIIMPSPLEDIKHSLAGVSAFSGLIMRHYAKKNRHFYTAALPFKVGMIPGAALLTTREVIEKVGLLDERYPLYFEDADWSRRVLSKGFKLYLAPDAEICHFISQSARHCQGESANKFRYSESLYRSRYYNRFFHLVSNGVSGAIHTFDKFDKLGKIGKLIKPGKPGGGVLTGGLTDLGRITTPPSFITDGCPSGGNSSYEHSSDGYSKDKFLFQLSTDLTFIPSVGMVSGYPSYTISDEIWSYIHDGVFFTRFIELASYKPISTWRFEKA
ncbi:MAG: glycosyltransferase family 2 protein [Nitrospirae bacterium]|nr:glycosyltransferase family 2 protein [Nitrospirota bacterium]